MTTLNKEDLQIIEYNDELLNALRNTSIGTLRILLEQWFSIHELRPRNNALFEYYDQLTLIDMRYRIVNDDWPNGLTNYQVAQMRFEKMKDRRKPYVQLQVTKMWGKEFDVPTIQVIKSRLISYFSDFHQAYVYATEDKKTKNQCFMIRLSRTDSQEYIHYNYNFLVYIPGTQYLAIANSTYYRECKEYFLEAVLNALGADDIHQKDLIQKCTLEELQGSILENRSGILALFRDGTFESSPIDIRQKKRKHVDTGFVEKGGDYARRIKPINVEEIKKRYSFLNQTEGVLGYRHLDLILDLPLDCGTELNRAQDVDISIPITLKLHGSNVSQGIRDLMGLGLIDTDAPDYISTVAVLGAKVIAVNQEGVSIDKLRSSNE